MADIKFSHPKLDEVTQDTLTNKGILSVRERADALRVPVSKEIENILIQTPELLLPYGDVSNFFDIMTLWRKKSYDESWWQNFMFENKRIEAFRGATHEFLNAQYIELLATHFIVQSKKFGLSAPIKILEIGAGNGVLTYFLQKELDKQAWASIFQVIATDNNFMGIPAVFDVRKETATVALDAHSPEFVLVSWMMPDDVVGSHNPKSGIKHPTDFGYCFEETASVHEYVLIGPTYTCGMPWATFNNHIRPCEDQKFIEELWCDDDVPGSFVSKYIPEYEWKMWRFTMRNLEHFLSVQLWAQNSIFRENADHSYKSRTVSFERIKK